MGDGGGSWWVDPVDPDVPGRDAGRGRSSSSMGRHKYAIRGR